MGAHQASSLEMVKDDRLNNIDFTILLLISKKHLKSTDLPISPFLCFKDAKLGRINLFD